MRLLKVGPNVEFEWTSHALRELAVDIAPSLKGGLGFLQENATQAHVDRAWGLLTEVSKVTRTEAEQAIRQGIPDLDDAWSKRRNGVVERLFRLPSSMGVLRRAILCLALHPSANHDGTVTVVTTYVEQKPIEPASS